MPQQPRYYRFKYNVEEDPLLKFGHQEERKAGIIEGEYHVLLPNGVTQVRGKES